MLVAGASPLFAFDAPGQPTGGPKKAAAKGTDGEGGAPADKKDDKAAAATQRVLDAGVAAYQADKTDQAIRAFDAAIRAGGLTNQQMARALYYRGLSYRKKGKPGLAIPDLTSAVWLKDGLSAPEKQEAIAQRAAAYSEAGVADVPQVAQPGAGAGGSLGADGWQSTAGGGATPSSATASAAPTSAPTNTPQTATSLPRPPPPAATQTSSSSGGGFFSSITNMFGGGSSSSSSSSTAVTTASIAPPPVATNWSETTHITAASPPPQPESLRAPAQPEAAAPPPAPSAPFATQTQVAAVAPPPAAQPEAAPAPAGKFHVQVAAVRSRSEAAALSVRLLSQHGSEFGSRRPEVEETVIGSMGTFYRVSVGPYASAEEPNQLCGSLRASGFDCLVIAQ
jgi:SPOR domain